MKIPSSVFFLIILSVFARAQNSQGYDYNINIKVRTDKEPEYPAGEMALFEYVFNNLEYPQDAVKAKLIGEVMLNFDVNPDSSLANFSVIKNVGYGIEERIIAILKPLKFSPGTINGNAVMKNITMSFPVEAQ